MLPNDILRLKSMQNKRSMEIWHWHKKAIGKPESLF